MAQTTDGLRTRRARQRALMIAAGPDEHDLDELRELLRTRYGRVMEGLARQLRSQLHHDPLTGAYEIAISVLGRD